MPIDELTLPRGVEFDNISLHYLMRVKSKLRYSTLAKLPLAPNIFGRRVEDLIAAFEREEPALGHLANTFDLIADVVTLHKLEKVHAEFLAEGDVD